MTLILLNSSFKFCDGLQAFQLPFHRFWACCILLNMRQSEYSGFWCITLQKLATLPSHRFGNYLGLHLQLAHTNSEVDCSGKTNLCQELNRGMSLLQFTALRTYYGFNCSILAPFACFAFFTNQPFIVNFFELSFRTGSRNKLKSWITAVMVQVLAINKIMVRVFANTVFGLSPYLLSL